MNTLLSHCCLALLTISCVSSAEAGIVDSFLQLTGRSTKADCAPTTTCDAATLNGCPQCTPANGTCCPDHYTCCPEVKSEKVKKSCWQTECEPVCIPPVRCPLFDCFRQDHCDPCAGPLFGGRFLSGSCGKIRVVNKLKKVDYECEKCAVEWHARCKTPCDRCD